MYDVIIIGCGIMGAASAYYLSRYNLRVAVLEMHNDVCCETTRANSAIIHAGYDPKPGTKLATYNVRGNELAKEICEKLDVAYNQIGSLVVAFSESEMEHVKELYERGVTNNVPGVRIVDQAELREMEPNIADNALGALYAPSAAIVNPWEYGIAMAETAVNNGAEIFLNTKVTDIKKDGEYWCLITNNGEYKAKYVINATGVYSDDIHNMVAEPSFKITPSAGMIRLRVRALTTLFSSVLTSLARAFLLRRQCTAT